MFIAAETRVGRVLMPVAAEEPVLSELAAPGFRGIGLHVQEEVIREDIHVQVKHRRAEVKRHHFLEVSNGMLLPSCHIIRCSWRTTDVAGGARVQGSPDKILS